MPVVREEMVNVIVRLERAIIDCARREGDDSIHLRPRPPATERMISDYEQYLQLKLPDSYRVFLQLYNGYAWLAFPGDMLAIQDVMPGGARFEEILAWKKMSAKYGGGEVLDGIMIASMGEPNDWVYLDPNRPLEGSELTVVSTTPSYSVEYQNLIEFFESRIECCNLEIPDDENHSL
jgi:hypothetical protein